MTLLITLGLL